MAHLSKPDLWAKIESYEFSDLQDGTSFEDYVKNNIKVRSETAALAITEYRQFIYLCMVAPGEAVPSKIVDMVWHAHLTQTRDYWERFCPDVLGCELHHVPGPDGFLETDAYANTLKMYETEFDSEPRALFWPRKHHSKSYLIPGIWGSAVLIVTAVITGESFILLGLFITFAMMFPPSIDASVGSFHTDFSSPGDSSNSSCDSD